MHESEEADEAIVVVVVGIETCHRVNALVEILACCLGTVEPKLRASVVGI